MLRLSITSTVIFLAASIISGGCDSTSRRLPASEAASIDEQRAKYTQAVKQMVSETCPVTDWISSLEKRYLHGSFAIYSLDIESALAVPDARPILISGALTDICRRDTGFQVILTIDSLLLPELVFKLDCEHWMAEAIRQANLTDFDWITAVAAIKSVERVGSEDKFVAHGILQRYVVSTFPNDTTYWYSLLDSLTDDELRDLAIAMRDTVGSPSKPVSQP